MVKPNKNRFKKSFFGRKKGQSFLEYSFLIAVSVASLIAMVNYFNRSLQGQLKETVDSVGKEFVGGGSEQMLPESGFRLSPVSGEVPRGDLFVGSSGNVTKTTTAFTYEGKRGYAVSLRHSKRDEVSKTGKIDEE